MTIDEELDRLEENIRQLKIEFDVFFNGASRRPPYDTQRRVENLIKKYSDGTGLTFGQRFRFNGLSQRYAVLAGQWRQRVKCKEEGPRRTAGDPRAAEGNCLEFRIDGENSSNEVQDVEDLFNAFREAKQRCGDTTDNMDPENFRRFVLQKNDQLKRHFGCEQVEYSVSIEEGRVKLKAKAL